MPRGQVAGEELTASYDNGGFSAYANLANSVAKGRDWDSAQFLFDPDDLAYVQNHWIFLDHDQQVTGSFGAAYVWKESEGSTRLYVDDLYGTGLRTDGDGARRDQHSERRHGSRLTTSSTSGRSRFSKSTKRTP